MSNKHYQSTEGQTGRLRYKRPISLKSALKKVKETKLYNFF